MENIKIDLEEAEIEMKDTISVNEHGVNVIENEQETENLIVSDSGREQDVFWIQCECICNCDLFNFLVQDPSTS